jgi:hypothetical protein
VNPDWAEALVGMWRYGCLGLCGRGRETYGFVFEIWLFRNRKSSTIVGDHLFDIT